MGRWEIIGLETRVGQECSIRRGGARLYSGGIHVGGSHSVMAGGAAPKVRAAKSLNLERESCEKEGKFGEGKL